MKVQAALEYLILVSMVLLFIVPIWAYTYSMEKYAKSDLSLTYAKNDVQKIVSAADLVYSQGPPAKVEIVVYIPPQVYNVTVVQNFVNFKMYYDSNLVDIMGESKAQLNGSVPGIEGTYTLSIEAINGNVQIQPK